MGAIAVGISKLIGGTQQIAESILALYTSRSAVLAARIFEDDGEAFKAGLAQVPDIVDGRYVLMHKDGNLCSRNGVLVDIDCYSSIASFDWRAADRVGIIRQHRDEIVLGRIQAVQVSQSGLVTRHHHRHVTVVKTHRHGAGLRPVRIDNRGTRSVKLNGAIRVQRHMISQVLLDQPAITSGQWRASRRTGVADILQRWTIVHTLDIER